MCMFSGWEVIANNIYMFSGWEVIANTIYMFSGWKMCVYYSWKPAHGEKMAVISAYITLFKKLPRLLEEQKTGALLVTELLLLFTFYECRKGNRGRNDYFQCSVFR